MSNNNNNNNPVVGPSIPPGMVPYVGYADRTYLMYDGVQSTDAAAWAAFYDGSSDERPCTCGSGVVWAHCPGNTNGCCG